MFKTRLGKNIIKTFVIFSVVVSTILASSGVAFALEPKDHVVMLSAQVQQSPPTIKLTWIAPPTAVTGYTVYRKEKSDTSWGTAVTTLSSTTLEYTDTNVIIGTPYEYKISSNYGNGYICSGIMLPEVVSRGKLVLLVANTYASQLSTELTRLQQDLVGDGWTVLRHDVSPTDSPSNVKAIIQSDYNADSQNVKALFIFGHVPVCKSGMFAPDAHDSRAWPADTYYGDMDGVWTDSNNDGVMDQNYIPSDVELQVGRVDLSSLGGIFDGTFYNKDELTLLRTYLNKDHSYRMGLNNLQMRGFVEDVFGEFGGEAFSRNAYGNFPQLLGATAIDNGVWRDTMPNQEYLWAYVNGYGTSHTTIVPSLNSGDIFANDYKATFGMMFGSFIGEWDAPNDLLRCFLGMPNYGLTNVWGGRPNWFFHHMGLGDNIGYSTKITQNNGGLYSEKGNSARGIHIALMGDPTLRMYVVQPPSNVQGTLNKAEIPVITWDAPATAVAGYHVFRAETEQGPFERITSNIIADNSFEDLTAQGKKYLYMVKSVVLESTPSGTFYNQSQGITGSSIYISVNATVDYDKKEVAIFGTTSEGEGSVVTLRVMNPLNNIDYINQTVSGAGGKYSFLYEMKNKIPDAYTVYVGGKILTVPTNTNFRIIPVENLRFYDTTGNEVQTLPQSGLLEIKASLRNDSISSFNASVIMAVYNSDHKLKQIVYADKQIDAAKSDILTASFNINNWEIGDFAKAFVWNGFNQIRNLGTTKILN